LRWYYGRRALKKTVSRRFALLLFGSPELMSTRIQRGTHVLCLLVALLLGPVPMRAQTLEAKLSQRADFVPTEDTSKGQLIQIAQHYKLPMGIEWVPTKNEAPRQSPAARSTVLEMIRFILQQQPGYVFQIRQGVANISSKVLTRHSANFLNLRLPEYSVDRANVFGAEWSLRTAIHQTLHPQRHGEGTNGGYGYGAGRDDGFDIRNISFSGRNLTVRDVLNRIVKANGNSLWVVELVPSKTMTAEPFFAQHVYGQDVQTEFAWQIIPISHDEKNKYWCKHRRLQRVRDEISDRRSNPD
jgi:hypothetical protein